MNKIKELKEMQELITIMTTQKKDLLQNVYSEQAFKLSSNEVKEDTEGMISRVISKNFEKVQSDSKTQFMELETQNKLKMCQM
jgi:hypothetical protein